MVGRAVMASFGVHAALLLALAWGATSRPVPAVTVAAWSPVGDEPARDDEAREAAATAVELRAPGDGVRDVAQPMAPSAAPNPDARAGAAARASGAGSGAPSPVTDRADATTLRAQPYDAARGYQMQRIASGATRESREQIRATPHPAPTPWLASLAGRGHGRARADRRAVRASTLVERDERDHAPPRAALRSASGTARPEVTRDPASTDAAQPSDDVADRVDQALVSDEKQPAPLELSRPSAPGDARAGSGPGTTPGYAPDGRGAAPVPPGAPGLPNGKELALATFQRAYDMYLLGVRQKVDPLWEFPRELAVKMEQGEVLVGFTIRKDGRVGDVRVLKGSGFAKFDANVVQAIKKASPFAPLPATLGSELHVTAPFEGANPAIR